MLPKIDMGASAGSIGPWLKWYSNGSAVKGHPPACWVLNGKDDNGNQFERQIDLSGGMVLNFDTLKLGWEREGNRGQGPDRRWNPSLEHWPDRPSEEKRNGGGYVWTRAFEIRVAIGNGQAATWGQAQYASYEAMTKLIEMLQGIQDYPAGMCPLVRVAQVVSEQLPNGSANLPVFELVKFVPLPECLRAPGINMGDDGGAPAQGYQQPQQPAQGYQPPQQPPQGYQQPQQPTYGHDRPAPPYQGAQQSAQRAAYEGQAPEGYQQPQQPPQPPQQQPQQPAAPAGNADPELGF